MRAHHLQDLGVHKIFWNAHVLAKACPEDCTQGAKANVGVPPASQRLERKICVPATKCPFKAAVSYLRLRRKLALVLPAPTCRIEQVEYVKGQSSAMPFAAERTAIPCPLFVLRSLRKFRQQQKN